MKAEGGMKKFYGINIQDVSLVKLGELLESRIVKKNKVHVVNLNPHLFLLSRRDDEFRSIYESSECVIADGVGVAMAAGLENNTFFRRYTGLDVMLEICKRAENRGFKVFLLGGLEGIVDRCSSNLKKLFPNLQLVGTFQQPNPYDPGELIHHEQLKLLLHRTEPDIVFVALGAPDQEKWIHANLHRTGAALMMGVGGSFNVIGGRLPRAPGWMCAIGLEWMFRLILEPRRLAARYLLGIPRFLSFVVFRRPQL